MILSDLIGKDVRCGGEHHGRVVDARFVLRGRVEGTLAQAELVGLLIGPRSGVAFLGYERRRMTRPALLKHLLTWRQHGTFLVDWVDVDHLGEHVELVPGYKRWSPVL